MRKKLHPLVLTIAICQVAFGVLVLACDGFGLINAFGLYMLASGSTPQTSLPPASSGPPKPGDEFNKGYAAGMEGQMTVLKTAPGYKGVQLGQALFGLLLGFVMIASGIGLFFMQSWARWLAIGYGVVSLLARCSCVGYHAAVVLPILFDLGNEFTKKGRADMKAGLLGLEYLPFAGLMLGLYPLLVVILLLLPQVSRAFQGEPAADAGPDDYHDRDDYRDRFRGDKGDDRYRSD